jgi:hypothetical protein
MSDRLKDLLEIMEHTAMLRDKAHAVLKIASEFPDIGKYTNVALDRLHKTLAETTPPSCVNEEGLYQAWWTLWIVSQVVENVAHTFNDARGEPIPDTITVIHQLAMYGNEADDMPTAGNA